ncbi:hypothetical protein GGR54DRAFT_640175 [Hypoxylon sp. NC1633]|nr:hypothetical protein GGR54DRAFT_640175 [Hypoxylon sp. NC1633]
MSGHTRTIPRIKNPRYTPEQLEEFAQELLLSYVGVVEGVSQIYECPSSYEIAFRLQAGEMVHVNFSSYGCEFLRDWPSSRTIEFRGAERDAIFVGIHIGQDLRRPGQAVRFAVHAPAVDFLRVLENCDLATKEDGKYDVIDLLDEFGMPAETALVEKRIEANKESWGLEYGVSFSFTP